MRSASSGIPRKIIMAALMGAWEGRLILGACSGLMIYAVLAYGGVHTWSYFPLGISLASFSLILLARTYYLLWTNQDAAVVVPKPPLAWGMLAAMALAFSQVLPWPRGLVGLASPAAVKIRALGNGCGLDSFIPLSLNPHATTLEFLKLWPAVVLFFILLYTVQSRRQIQALTAVILAIALFEAFYGFWHFRTQLIWGWKNPYTGMRLCGTFINSNHLAGYLTMAILLGFGLFLAKKETIPPLPKELSGNNKLTYWSRPEYIEPRLRRYLTLFIVFLLAVALFFTGSRGGIISLFVGFALMSLLIWVQKRQKSQAYLMVFLLITALLYSLWLGSSALLERFFDLDQQYRYQACRGALAIFREFPLAGSGIGTFGEVFYRFEPAAFGGVLFDYTHNEWLQVLAETGLVGFILLSGMWLLFFNRLVQRWRHHQATFARGLGLGCLAALAAGAFHALVDFPFRVPGFTLTYAAIAAMAYLILHSQRRSPEVFSYPVIHVSWRRRVVPWAFLGVLAVQICLMLLAWRVWQAERAAPTAIDSTQVAVLAEARDWRRALSFNPRNGHYHAGLAEALGREDVSDPKALTQMEGLLRHAIYWAPAHWGHHLKLAELYQKCYPNDPGRNLLGALRELDAAVYLFPESGPLHLRLGVFLAWMERYYNLLVPYDQRGRAKFHLEEAMRLDPSLKKYSKALTPITD